MITAQQRDTVVLTFGEALARATMQAMEQDERVFVYGEGINDPGGFFGSTVGVKERFSEARCFDVPNSEEALMGFGIGAGLMGHRPVFVNLRVEFLMLAMNQLVNHAARLPTMSGYQCTIPMTVRAIIGKSWGQAAQHASSLHSLFANIPGLQVVVPSSVQDAPRLLLASIQSDMPTVFIELKSLYDLKAPVPLPVEPLPLGQAQVVRPGADLTCVAISEMVGFAERVAERLAPLGIEAEVLDLRTLAPLDAEAILTSVKKTRRVAVFDIGWEPFGLAAEVARVVSTSDQFRLAGPLLSVARAHEHTPASCFLEYRHYPTEEETVTRVRALFSRSDAS
ncbi:MAG: transketolase C-terminal domain-containing protein [Candidatus Omnitrophota bacterium]|nr:transketolase C-terminal domain-containing protein [Candidatus Omnitrophota bacterium]